MGNFKLMADNQVQDTHVQEPLGVDGRRLTIVKLLQTTPPLAVLRSCRETSTLVQR